MTIKIPRCLFDKLTPLGARFCLVIGKSPEEHGGDWNNPKNLVHANDQRLLNHLKRGFCFEEKTENGTLYKYANYGVVTVGGLIIIDADSKIIIDFVRKNLPETFEVYSPGNEGVHFYFLCSLSKGLKFHDEDGADLGEIKVSGMCVGPNSIHERTRTSYEVIRDVPIATLSVKLLDVFEPFLKSKDVIDDAEKRMLTKAKHEKYENEYNLNIEDVISLSSFKKRKGKNEYDGNHPVHGGETGTNLSVNPVLNSWWCRACDAGGGPFQFLAVEAGLINCVDSVPGVLKGPIFRDVLKIAVDKGLIDKSALKKSKKPIKITNYGLDFYRYDNKRFTCVRIADDIVLRLNLAGKYLNKLIVKALKTTNDNITEESEIITMRTLKKNEFNKIASQFTNFSKQIFGASQTTKKVIADNLCNVYKALLNNDSYFTYEIKSKKQRITKLTGPVSLKDIITKTNEKYPTLGKPLTNILSGASTTYIDGIKSPAWIDFVAVSSFGKSVLFGLMSGFEDVEVVDDLSRASLVSGYKGQDENGADIIEDPSMLLKLHGKIVIVSDLSPLMTLPKEFVVSIIGMLTRIYDGEGYCRWTGTRGKIFYEDVKFSMMSGATPVYEKHWDIFEQLGSRKLIIRPNNLTRTERDERKKARTKHRGKLLKIDRKLKSMVHKFLSDIKKKGPIKWDTDKDEKDALNILNAYSEIMSRLRSGVFIVNEEWVTEWIEPYHDSKGDLKRGYHKNIRIIEKGVNIEEPDRAFTQLYNLTRGYAICNNRDYITKKDAKYIAPFIMSSCKNTRGLVFRGIIKYFLYGDTSLTETIEKIRNLDEQEREKKEDIDFSEGFTLYNIQTQDKFSEQTTRLHFNDLIKLNMLCSLYDTTTVYYIKDNRILEALDTLNNNEILEEMIG